MIIFVISIFVVRNFSFVVNVRCIGLAVGMERRQEVIEQPTGFEGRWDGESRPVGTLLVVETELKVATM